MIWNLEGYRVSGRYMGEHYVSGRVILSRVKYGGAISHTVVLEDPIEVYGSIRTSVILEPIEILSYVE